MPQSRKRSGHLYNKPADIPARQRTKGRIVWAVLLGLFGLLTSLFASEGSTVAVVAGTVAAVVLGYFIGKHMEKEASGK